MTQSTLHLHAGLPAPARVQKNLSATAAAAGGGGGRKDLDNDGRTGLASKPVTGRQHQTAPCFSPAGRYHRTAVYPRARRMSRISGTPGYPCRCLAAASTWCHTLTKQSNLLHKFSELNSSPYKPLYLQENISIGSPPQGLLD